MFNCKSDLTPGEHCHLFLKIVDLTCLSVTPYPQTPTSFYSVVRSLQLAFILTREQTIKVMENYLGENPHGVKSLITITELYFLLAKLQASLIYTLLSTHLIYQYPIRAQIIHVLMTPVCENKNFKGATSRYFELFFGLLEIVKNWKDIFK